MQMTSDRPQMQSLQSREVFLAQARGQVRNGEQWENALGVARAKGARMNRKYLFEQARNLGIEEDLTTLRDEGGI